MAGIDPEGRIWADDGLLIWDGRALELYRTDGRHDGWRVDAQVIARWVVEESPSGGSTLKLYTTEGHFAATSIPESARSALDRMLVDVERRRPER